ncbi:intracellular septation protein IspA [Klebsiella michiganensis]|uniref:Inner membrane-spanning protein YciB n=1 Tax=Klebsiella michiganensis TaxID=1134687 RepID=A0A7H4LUI2_9ENTR|nr:intracellular septation protein IspA [Klebsiella michiganensis]
MKQFLDFLPLVVFFAFYKLYDIYAATTALIIATAIVLIYSWVRYRKVEKMALITFVLVAVFGGLTIFFHNDEFIKWKVTVIYVLFASALLFSQWVMKKPLIQRMLGKELTLPQQVWSRLNLAWAVFSSFADWRISISLSGCRRISGQLQGLWFDRPDAGIHPAERRVYLSPYAAGRQPLSWLSHGTPDGVPHSSLFPLSA